MILKIDLNATQLIELHRDVDHADNHALDGDGRRVPIVRVVSVKSPDNNSWVNAVPEKYSITLEIPEYFDFGGNRKKTPLAFVRSCFEAIALFPGP